ncbi:MAG: hypothetical protein OEW12_01295 [Deltaproteobacteria bacterium]|nr:hypothetical protein [Deltaproteobacteria bacterium]
MEEEQESRAGAIPENIEELLRAHRRFVEDFSASLENAHEFVRQADGAMESEPEETAEMLLTIQNIGILENIRNLREDFNWLKSFLGWNEGVEEDTQMRVELQEVDERYEALEDEARIQQEEIEELLQRAGAG